MKKIIITTSLKIIPKKLQNKALCKALNYLFSTIEMTELKDSIIKLNISDIKKSWFVIYGENGFEAVKLRKVNLEIKTKLNIAMAFDNKTLITDALKQGDLQLIGEDKFVNTMHQHLLSLDESRLDNLSYYLFSFLNIKSKKTPRLDIDKVQLSDLQHKLDIDFIRDEALRLEKSDLKKAFFLMELAHQARPNGAFIKQKVAEYQIKLKV